MDLSYLKIQVCPLWSFCYTIITETPPISEQFSDKEFSFHPKCLSFAYKPIQFQPHFCSHPKPIKGEYGPKHILLIHWNPWIISKSRNIKVFSKTISVSDGHKNVAYYSRFITFIFDFRHYAYRVIFLHKGGSEFLNSWVEFLIRNNFTCKIHFLILRHLGWKERIFFSS